MEYRKTILADERSIRKISSKIDEILIELEVPEELITKIQIILEEVLTNIIYHGYNRTTYKFRDKKINIYLTCSNHTINITFKDYSEEYGFVLQAERTQMQTPKVGGMGLFILKGLSDNLVYKRKDNANILEVYIKR